MLLERNFIEKSDRTTETAIFYQELSSFYLNQSTVRLHGYHNTKSMVSTIPSRFELIEELVLKFWNCVSPILREVANST